MDRAERELLQELLCAYGPGGHEDAVRAVCRRELEPVADETKPGSMVTGRSSPSPLPSTRLMLPPP